jgi:hypothetical protein
MTDEIEYFVVEQSNGRQYPAKYADRLPDRYRAKQAQENGLRYQLRIDDKPHLAGRSIDDLFAEWRKRGGNLPEKPDRINPTWPARP